MKRDDIYKYNGLKSPLWSGLYSPLFSPFSGSAIAGGGGDPLLTAALALSPVFLYDHKDITSFYADDAMTTPATVGGVVGAVRDKSGNGRHRKQTLLARKPILRQSGALYYLEFDGIDDALFTDSIDLSSTDAVTLCVGMRKLTDAAEGIVVEFSPSYLTNNGSFAIRSAVAGAASFTATSKGSAVSVLARTGITAPATRVLTMTADISADSLVFRDNGSGSSIASDQGTGNYGNYAFYWGARGGTSARWNGYDYGGALYAVVYSGAQLDAIEDFVADRTGVTLP